MALTDVIRVLRTQAMGLTWRYRVLREKCRSAAALLRPGNLLTLFIGLFAAYLMYMLMAAPSPHSRLLAAALLFFIGHSCCKILNMWVSFAIRQTEEPAQDSYLATSARSLSLRLQNAQRAFKWGAVILYVCSMTALFMLN